MKFWWRLSNKEKSVRSFITAPFVLLALFVSDEVTFFTLNKWEFTGVAILLFLLQGIYYKRKADRDISK